MVEIIPEEIAEVIAVQAYIVPLGCLQIHNRLSEWQNQIPESQLSLPPQCFAGHKSEAAFPVAPSGLNSLLATSVFIAPKTQPLHLKLWGKDLRGKQHKEKTASVHILTFKSPKLFAIASHCHWSGKAPISDSLSIFLGSSYYSGTRQKQRSCVSNLPIVETQNLDLDPNFCLQNYGSKPTGWCDFGWKLLYLSSSRERKFSLVR